MTVKFNLQNRQYQFPYHYIPHFDEKGRPSRLRFLNWGMEYLCYMLHIRDEVCKLQPKSILDIGCGDGFFLGILPDIIENKCGVDLSEQAISFANAFHPNINYKCMNAKDIAQTYDVVTAIEVMEHVPDDEIQDFVNTLWDRIKPGGHLIITVPSVNIPLQNKHYRHYDPYLLQKHVLSGAHKVEIKHVCTLVDRKDLFYRLYLKLTSNRIWKLDIPYLNRMMWDRMWNTRESDIKGSRVCGVFQKDIDH